MNNCFMIKSRIISIFSILFICLVIFTGCRKSDYLLDNDVVTVRDYGNGTGTVTWSCDKSYMLEGKVFVNDGQVLTIEPGTVIRSKTGQGNASSALIIARGGKIIAKGTREDPIIFTAEGDDLAGSVPVFTKGLWGGLIILGNAKINIEGGEAHIEGIPVTEPRAVYGGFDDSDNSGILEYVSIRHGGTNIGQGNEINGLTFGGVGNGTTVNNVEIVSSADDGIEFFGGTVNCRNIIVAYCGDDAFDYDLGYRGKGQFWLAIQHPAEGDKLLEGDGGVNPIIALPYSNPEIYNVTFIGRGNDIVNFLVSFSRNAGGNMVNSILINQGKGMSIEYNTDRDDSFRQLEIGNLVVKNNIFYNVADDTKESICAISAETGIDISEELAYFQKYFTEAENSIQDPVIIRDEIVVYPIPEGNVNQNLAPYTDEWFIRANYKGAFGSYNWTYKWSLLSQEGLLE